MRSFIFILSFMISLNLAEAEQRGTDKIKKATGRIIHVYRGPGFLRLANTCTAALIAQDKIITASHCFKTKQILKAKQKILNATIQMITLERMYFDIDGVTSQGLGEKIYALANDNGAIVGDNIKIANEILEKLPEIKTKDLHPLYEKNMLLDFSSYRSKNQKDLDYKMSMSLKNTAFSTLYDIATAQLDKKINTEFLKVDNYVYGEDILVSGYAGGDLTAPLVTTVCQSGKTAYDNLVRDNRESLATFDTIRNHIEASDMVSIDRVRLNDNLTKENVLAKHELEFYAKLNESGIISECNGDDGRIMRGYSGGPQVVIRNNEAILVGITSQTPILLLNGFGKFPLGTRAIKVLELK